RAAVRGRGDFAGRHPARADQLARQVDDVGQQPAENGRLPGGPLPDLIQAVTGRNDEITRPAQRPTEILLELPVRFRHFSRSTDPGQGPYYLSPTLCSPRAATLDLHLQNGPQRGHSARGVALYRAPADSHGGSDLGFGKVTVVAQHERLTLSSGQPAQ